VSILVKLFILWCLLAQVMSHLHILDPFTVLCQKELISESLNLLIFLNKLKNKKAEKFHLQAFMWELHKV